jgi:ribosomal protein S1
MKDDLLAIVADFSDAHEALERISKSHANDPWFDADRRMPRGSTKVGVVQNNSSVGYFVEFSDGLVGLVHKTRTNGISASPGDRVEVEILWVDLVQRRMALKFIAVLEEDAGDQIEGTHESVLRQDLTG